MRSIAMIHGLARCGGTVISRCIGCMEQIVMLHEIHANGPALINNLFPGLGVQFNVLYQAVNWYPFLFAAEDQQWVMSKIRNNNEPESIEGISSRVHNHGLSLVIRDWSHLDFVGKPFLADVAYRLSLKESLSNRFTINEAFILRHPISQYLSMISSGPSHAYLFSESGVKHYLKGYRAFAEFASSGCVIKYEDFISSPAVTIKQLARYLGVPFDPDFSDKWKSYEKYTGDNMRRDSKTITPTKHRALDPGRLQMFMKSSDYHESNQLLGYSLQP